MFSIKQAFCVLIYLTHSSDATIDLSNVDLVKFKYFKYSHKPPPLINYQNSQYNNNQPILAATATHIPSSSFGTVHKFKAMIQYFSSVLFGNLQRNEVSIIFDPEFGKKWRPHFEKQFGSHGERLVELLGQGYRKNDLINYGALSKD